MLLESPEGPVISTVVQYDQVPGRRAPQKPFLAEVQRLGCAELQESVYNLEPVCLAAHGAEMWILCTNGPLNSTYIKNVSFNNITKEVFFFFFLNIVPDLWVQTGTQ